MTVSPGVGGDLLRLLTAGMYDNPLVLYREYVQNAADAIASAKDGGSVHIRIDPSRSRITILDDGPGLPRADAVRRLVDVGRSPKDPATDRGFRGIGRLAALAFADEVHFTTRVDSAVAPLRVTWSGRALRELDLANVDVQTAIQECTTIRSVSDGTWPDHFFEVDIERVNRHAASLLLNEDAVRRYVAEVCPVPLRASFPLADEIRGFLASYTESFTLDIRINDTTPVTRPFAETLPLTDEYGAPFESIDTRVIPSLDDDYPAAVLWLAHTPYMGSIPRRFGVRGLRARAGNLQIGTDRVFERLFQEPRFNGWCVGEVHILDHGVLPNGRRDYFEPGPHLRNLENHLGAVAHEISARCRLASSQRNKLRNVGGAIHRLTRARDLALSGYLRPPDVAALVARERQRIPGIRQTLAQVEATGQNADRHDLALCETQFESLEVNADATMDALSPGTRDTVQTAFGAIADCLPPNVALELIEAILARLCLDSTTAARMPPP